MDFVSLAGILVVGEKLPAGIFDGFLETLFAAVLAGAFFLAEPRDAIFTAEEDAFPAVSDGPLPVFFM
ncbi:MAG: hypothetical protein M0Z60_06180 [Nitrospiraceae bacterium]|nr:hypothetical protein [Nitrospiraceae bacterium]